jgi:hypothetical protein
LNRSKEKEKRIVEKISTPKAAGVGLESSSRKSRMKKKLSSILQTTAPQGLTPINKKDPTHRIISIKNFGPKRLDPVSSDTKLEEIIETPTKSIFSPQPDFQTQDVQIPSFHHRDGSSCYSSDNSKAYTDGNTETLPYPVPINITDDQNRP